MMCLRIGGLQVGFGMVWFPLLRDLCSDCVVW